MGRGRQTVRKKADGSMGKQNTTGPGTRTRQAKRGPSSPTAAKPSRLQPSEPLHMTTRAASKAASIPPKSVAGSVAGSLASANSRRNSSEATQQDAESDADFDRPAKRPRVSTESSPDQAFFEASGDGQTPDDQTPHSRASSKSSGISSKRKRNFRSSTASDQVHAVISADTNGVPKKRESEASPALQPAVFGRRKRKTAAPPLPDQTEVPPELTDASTPPGSPEPILENEIHPELQNVLPTPGSEPPAKNLKRLPGRRRQPHANINVEADLRRQLSLKTGYRSVVKALKPILDELAERTVLNLENYPDCHVENEQYQEVTGHLDKRLNDRKRYLEAVRYHQEKTRVEVLKGNLHNIDEQTASYITDLKEDFMLKCMHRALQVEREWKAENGDATDDEDYIVIPPQRGLQSTTEANNRLPSKYDSRSRAYLVTEEAFDEDAIRRVLARAQKQFMEANGKNHLTETANPGFASFVGPNRGVAMSMFNLLTLTAAADTVVETDERARAILQPPAPKVISNNEATALSLLASLSAERVIVQDSAMQTASNAERSTPPSKAQFQPPASPACPPSAASTAMSLETAKSSPGGPLIHADIRLERSARREMNGVQSPSKAIKETPARVYTNKITDLLNTENDEPMPHIRDQKQSSSTYDFRTEIAQHRPENAGTSMQPELYLAPPKVSSNNQYRGNVPSHAQPSVQHLPTLGPAISSNTGTRSYEKSPPRSTRFWSSANASNRARSKSITPDGSSEKNPIARIRQMRHSAGPKSPSVDPMDGDRLSENAANETKVDLSSRPRRESFDRPNMAPPSLPTYAHERSSSVSESRRTSLGQPSAPSPSQSPFTYSQSPHSQHAQHIPPPRPSSLEQGQRPHWEDSRRASAPQQPPPPVSPYGPPPQGYAPDFNGQARPPPQSGPQLPPFVQTQQQPPQYNYRFAHYDPPQSRPPPSTYPSASHPAGPPAHQSPYPPPGHPHQYQQPPSYSGPPGYHGYQGPTQGYHPPPPPPPQQQSPHPYPPLKIQQYGGQPILPANLAPYSQPPVHSPYGQTAHVPAFSQAPPPKHHFEHTTAPGPQQPPHHEQQQSSRRKYRAYMAQGTEFRNYTGPTPPRRRGG